MYAQDYDEKLPFASCGGQYWTSVIQPYVKNVQMFYCPSDPGVFPGYGWNYSGCGYAPGTQWSPARTGAIYEGCSLAIYNSPGPSETFMLGDSGAPTASWQRYYLYQSATYHPRRHNDGDNYAFVDGHCKWMKDDAVNVTDMWDAD